MLLRTRRFSSVRGPRADRMRIMPTRDRRRWIVVQVTARVGVAGFGQHARSTCPSRQPSLHNQSTALPGTWPEVGKAGCADHLDPPARGLGVRFGPGDQPVLMATFFHR
jgi:hypothetical protein